MTSESLRKHILHVHEKKRPTYTCTICNKRFNSGYLKTHIKAVHEKIRQWTCKFEGCSKDFAHLEGYKDHMRSIHEKIKRLCDICGWSTNQRVALKKHKTRNHEDEINEKQKVNGSPFPCTICEKVLNSEKLLKEHLQFIHNLLKDEIENNAQNLGEKLKKVIKCEFCDDVFNYQSTLSNHVNVVHLGNGHACEYCGKMSTSANNLKIHIEAIHKKSTKCTCTICGRVLRDKTVLKYHIQTVHERIKDHLCPECGKSFPKNYSLKAHLAAVHSIGIKQSHICDECGKNFGRKTCLRIHIETVHNGVKKQCQFCNSKFTQSGTLRAHIKKHHPVGNGL